MNITINNQNSIKNTNFGKLDKIDTSNLSNTGKKVAKKLLESSYINKLSLNQDISLSIKSETKTIDNENNVLLFKLLAKNGVEYFDAFALGTKIKLNNINNLTNKIIKQLSESFKYAEM